MLALPTLLQQPTPLSLAQAPIPQADLQRKQEMREAWKAYRGEFADPLLVEKNQPNDNVKPNRCAPIVDKGVSFLFGPVLKVTSQDKGYQGFIDGLWGDDDDRMTMLAEMEMNGGVCGQNFVKLIPAPLGSASTYPRIVILNPELVRIVTHPEDCSLHLAYVIEYPGVADWQKRQIIARVDPENDLEQLGNFDPQDTWTINTYVRRGSGREVESAWQLVGIPEEWPYPFAPIVCNKNLPNPNEPWGVPDLTDDLIQMNKVINFNKSNISRILKYFADPKLVASGVDASQIRMAIGEILCLPSIESKLWAIEAKGDIAAALNFLMTLLSDMDERSRVPAVALGRETSLPRGNISGVALQLLFQPLIEKTTLKRRLYGKMIREVCRNALVLAGLLPVEQYKECKIDLPWGSLLPVDDLAAAQAAQILKAIGISDQTLLSELGYDPDIEIKQSAKEDARKQALLPPQLQQQQGQPPVTEPGQQDAQQPQQQAEMG